MLRFRLPEVDYPTIRWSLLSGRESRCHLVRHHRAAGTAVRRTARTEPNDFDQFRRQFDITLQFVLNLNIDVAEQEVQAAINAAQTYLPAVAAPPFTAIQSGGRANLSWPSPRKFSTLPGRGLHRHPARAKNRAGDGRRLVTISADKNRPSAFRSIGELLAYGINLDDVRTALQRPA